MILYFNFKITQALIIKTMRFYFLFNHQNSFIWFPIHQIQFINELNTIKIPSTPGLRPTGSLPYTSYLNL